jgi:hypothetical protein
MEDLILRLKTQDSANSIEGKIMYRHFKVTNRDILKNTVQLESLFMMPY